jgi:hypothetical protein
MTLTRRDGARLATEGSATDALSRTVAGFATEAEAHAWFAQDKRFRKGGGSQIQRRGAGNHVSGSGYCGDTLKSPDRKIPMVHGGDSAPAYLSGNPR